LGRIWGGDEELIVFSAKERVVLCRGGINRYGIDRKADTGPVSESMKVERESVGDIHGTGGTCGEGSSTFIDSRYWSRVTLFMRSSGTSGGWPTSKRSKSGSSCTEGARDDDGIARTSSITPQREFSDLEMTDCGYGNNDLVAS
jgi:hypothetical protein